AGRVVALRHHGKTCFAHLMDQTGRIQLYARGDQLGDDYPLFTELDLGDFIGVTGDLMRTRTGELTVAVKAFTFLAKSLRPLPEKWHGLKDVETRYRQRYVDLVVNEESRKIFRLRSRAVSSRSRRRECSRSPAAPSRGRSRPTITRSTWTSISVSRPSSISSAW